MLSFTNLKVATAHLTSRKKQAAIAILSVTFGVGMFIFMNSFIGGINQLQADLVFSNLAHIRIYNEVKATTPDYVPARAEQVVHLRNAKNIQYTEGIRDAQQLADLLQERGGFTQLTMQVNEAVSFKSGAVRRSGILSGVDVTREKQLFDMGKFIRQGSWEALNTSSNHIAIGSGLAKKLGVTLGSSILLTTTEGVSKNFTIVALLYTGNPAVDDNKAFVRRSAALQLLSKNQSYATDIQINIADFNKAESAAAALAPMVPSQYKIESWQQANEQLVAGNKLRDMIGTIVPIVLLIVAGFGIYNIMTMTVNEKIKEIAILKALGFGGRDVVEIFLAQAVFIGILGGIVGLGLGYLLSSLMAMMPFRMAAAEHIPIQFLPSTYASGFFIGFFITALAGYLPARKAAKVDPVQIIRG